MPAYAPFVPGYAPTAARPAFPLARYPGRTYIGAEAAAPAEEGVWGKTKKFLQDDSVVGHGVKNGYLLGGAAAIGTIWYGYSVGWFR